jgi:hypothetical protein
LDHVSTLRAHFISGIVAAGKGIIEALSLQYFTLAQRAFDVYLGSAALQQVNSKQQTSIYSYSYLTFIHAILLIFCSYLSKRSFIFIITG